MAGDYADERLAVLARGSNCPTCKATPDEPCRTRHTGTPTQPHGTRIDRAVRLYLEQQQTEEESK